MRPDSLLSTLSLSGRARVTLRRAGVDTVGQLVALTSEQVLRLPGAGQGLVSEIEAAVREAGLALGAPLESGAAPAGERDAPRWTLRLRRRIEPLPLDRPDQVWFEGELDDVELRQLAAEVLGVPAEEARALLRGTRAELREARRADVADVLVEWWDVVDGDQEVGRLYLWAGDAGVLYMPPDANTPTPEGILQGSWHGDPAIGERLHGAAAHLKSTGEARDSQVHQTRFRRRPRKPPPMHRLRAAAARLKSSD